MASRFGGTDLPPEGETMSYINGRVVHDADAHVMETSKYVRRQVLATPFPNEDVGWIFDKSDPSVCLFSSDHPHSDHPHRDHRHRDHRHREGRQRPFSRFETLLGDRAESAQDPFYLLNFIDLMGAGLPAAVAVGTIVVA